ncbi:MAG: hypothetical protein QME12_01545 [Nanoarchaeota archaeon]|nr:hypothetical protein [Nanoarchaeota archaeon]
MRTSRQLIEIAEINRKATKELNGFLSLSALMRKEKTIDCIDAPGKYFLGQERDTLVCRLAEIARNGFGTKITMEDVENHVMNVDTLYLIRQEKKIIGFSSYDVLNLDEAFILYLSGIVVEREFQKHGFFNMVNKLALSSGNFDFVAMRTQNPVIYAATEKLVKRLYPNKEGTPESIRQLASIIARDYLKMERFCEETMVGKATYGTCLYDKVQRHPRADDFFDNVLNVDYNAGDSVLLLGGLK